MAVGITRDLSQHSQTTMYGTSIMRAPSPFFSPPFPTGMQEPGTNWYTIVTADGPHTVEKPGLAGGIRVSSNNRRQDPVRRLTRKGG